MLLTFFPFSHFQLNPVNEGWIALVSYLLSGRGKELNFYHG